MTDKAKYILFNTLDWSITWLGSAGVIVANYLSEHSTGYKITFTGIVLLIALVLTAKAMFEKFYRRKLDTLLQNLALATTSDEKQNINANIEKLKIEQNVYNRLTVLLPFFILYAVSYFGEMQLHELRTCVGFVLMTLGVGSVFNVIKSPYYSKWQFQKASKK